MSLKLAVIMPPCSDCVNAKKRSFQLEENFSDKLVV